jgi:hypothetical protein
MPKTFEELRAEYLALGKKRDDELAAVQKKFGLEITKSGRLVVAACDHALVVESRTKKYHPPQELHINFDTGPLGDTEPLVRVCCLCSHVETADSLTKKFKTLTVEPFQYFFDHDNYIFGQTAEKYCRMPLSALRAEAERLRKKGGE